MKWYILALKKYATFSGRSQRMEYWMFVLFNILFSAAAKIIDMSLGLDQGVAGGLISPLFSLAMFVPGLAVTVRRFHDIGKSGWTYVWFMLAGMVALGVYIVYLVSLIVAAGLSATDLDLSAMMMFVTPTLLFLLVVLLIAIWMIYYMAKDSQPGTNKWGPNPKEPEVNDFTSFQ